MFYVGHSWSVSPARMCASYGESPPSYSPPRRPLLAKHRYASHVLQTAFELASHTITREVCPLGPFRDVVLTIAEMSQQSGNTVKVTSSEELDDIKSMTDLVSETAEVHSSVVKAEILIIQSHLGNHGVAI